MNNFQLSLFAAQWLLIGLCWGSFQWQWGTLSVIAGIINLSPLSGAKPWDYKKY